MIYRPPEQSARERGGAADREIVAGLLAMAFLMAGLVWLTSDVWCPKAPRLCLPDSRTADQPTPAATAGTPMPVSGGLVPGQSRPTPGTPFPVASDSGFFAASPTPFDYGAAALPTYPTFPTDPPFGAFATDIPGGGFPIAPDPFATPTPPLFPEYGGGAGFATETSVSADRPTRTRTPTEPSPEDDETPPAFVTATSAAYP